jgi:hypothetical protein
MVGFKAFSEVTKDDFGPVIMEVEKSLEKNGKFNYMLVLENSPKDFTMGAWFQDGFMEIKNLSNWNLAAIVTESEIVIDFTDAFSKIIPGEFRGFHKDEI